MRQKNVIVIESDDEGDFLGCLSEMSEPNAEEIKVREEALEKCRSKRQICNKNATWKRKNIS